MADIGIPALKSNINTVIVTNGNEDITADLDNPLRIDTIDTLRAEDVQSMELDGNDLVLKNGRGVEVARQTLSSGQVQDLQSVLDQGSSASISNPFSVNVSSGSALHSVLIGSAGGFISDSDVANSNLGTRAEVSTDSNHPTLKFRDKSTGNEVTLVMSANGITINDLIRNRGVTGGQDFSPNLQSLDYTQKSYVDFGNLIDLPFNASLNLDLSTGLFFDTVSTSAYTLTFSNVPQDVVPKRSGFGVLTVEVGAISPLTLGANIINIGGIAIGDIQQTIGKVYTIMFYTKKGITYMAILNEE